MSAFRNHARACLLTLVVIGAVGLGAAAVALWPADAAQREGRVWIRDGDGSCRHVPIDEAIGAKPCQG